MSSVDIFARPGVSLLNTSRKQRKTKVRKQAFWSPLHREDRDDNLVVVRGIDPFGNVCYYCPMNKGEHVACNDLAVCPKCNKQSWRRPFGHWVYYPIDTVHYTSIKITDTEGNEYPPIPLWQAKGFVPMTWALQLFPESRVLLPENYSDVAHRNSRSRMITREDSEKILSAVFQSDGNVRAGVQVVIGAPSLAPSGEAVTERKWEDMSTEERLNHYEQKVADAPAVDVVAAVDGLVPPGE